MSTLGFRRNTETAKTNNTKSQFEVCGATISTYLRWSDGIDPTTRQRMIFKITLDITRSMGLSMGVVKRVYRMIISAMKHHNNVTAT